MIAGTGAARADEPTWTQLPASEWKDEFSPLWTDGHGMLCEGDPNGPEDDEENPEPLLYTRTNE